jgi:hypothetical protein
MCEVSFGQSIFFCVSWVEGSLFIQLVLFEWADLDTSHRASKGKQVNIPAPQQGSPVATQMNLEKLERALGRVFFSY